MAVKKEQMLKVEQIRQEIRFLSELKHSNNIVKFIESNENEPFDNILEFRIILELAEGKFKEYIKIGNIYFRRSGGINCESKGKEGIFIRGMYIEANERNT